MAEQKSAETGTSTAFSNLISMQSVHAVLGGTVQSVNRFIERSEPQAQPGSDRDERVVQLSVTDRKWIVQLSICLLTTLSVPLFIVLLLVASSSGSTMGLIVSLLVLACCCCIGCGNVQWVRKSYQEYQPIQ
mmetsp:Transcript_33900/g.54295  ORF Transcript_33900/g.54295 Transcript_33900/m.54295 type:complete len:132 (-) Transcript_33900:1490-1885(-)